MRYRRRWGMLRGKQQRRRQRDRRERRRRRQAQQTVRRRCCLPRSSRLMWLQTPQHPSFQVMAVGFAQVPRTNPRCCLAVGPPADVSMLPVWPCSADSPPILPRVQPPTCSTR